MKYPKSKKSAKLYASWLSELHNQEWIPIEHPEKERGLINFAAIKKDEIEAYKADGWEIID